MRSRPTAASSISWLAIMLTLLAASLGLSPHARAQVSLALGDASLAAGDSGTVSATITTGGAAVALQFDILYDPAILSLGTVNGGAALTGSHSIASNPIAPGRDRVVITTSPVVALNSGTLATINFAVADTAVAGTTSLTFAGVVISDASALPISPSSLTPGTITITGGAPAPVEPEAIPASPVWVLVLLASLLAGLARRALGRYRRALAMSVLGLLVLAPLASVTQAQTLPGDANGDGRIDAEDVRLIVERILERGVLPGDGDCNRDATINVLDTVCSQLPFVPGETAPIILGPGDRSIPAQQAFEMNLFAADPDDRATQSWALVSGPSALGVSTDGVLTWTPGSGDVGSNPVTVRVTDDTGRTDEAGFDIVVFTVAVTGTSNAPPQLTVPPNQLLAVGTPLSAQASATDPDAGDTLTFRLVDGPTGMSIDPASGALSWVPGPAQARTADVVVEVSDGNGGSTFGTFQVTATPLNTGPTARDDVYIARRGETLSIPASEGVLQNDADPQDDPLAATRLSDPTLGTLGAFNADGSFSYTPTEPERITIGLEMKCETDISDFGVIAGTSTAADVDGDGAVELVGFANTTTGSRVFIVDPMDCSAVVNPLPVEMGQPSAESLATAVNLDDDPELELVIPYFRFAAALPDDESAEADTRLMAVNLDGSPVAGWPLNGLSEGPTFLTGFNGEFRNASPVAVDLNGDGTAELLAAYTQVGPAGLPAGTCRAVRANTACNAVVAWDGRTGEILWTYIGGVTEPLQRSMSPTIVDLDMDGDTEIIWNQLVLDHEGNLLFELPVERTILVADFELYGNEMLTIAIGNFDNDPYPEIVGYDATNFYLFSHDGNIQWQRAYDSDGFRFPWSDLLLAELDGDPFPELVTMLRGDGDGPLTLRAFDSDGEPLWDNADQFPVSGLETHSSSPVAIDLDRDGIDEIIQFKKGATASESGLYILDGMTGSVITSFVDPGLTQGHPFSDEPLTVADLDGDGSAEIVTNFNGPTATFEPLQIWGGLPGEPFPPARPIRSQTSVQPTWVKVDGSLPTTIAPHWLQPGRNYWHRIVPDLDPLTPEQDSFTYEANDGEFDTATATVNIEIRPNGNPPFFLSEPRRGASAGTAYRYQPLVTDVDPGDSVTFELLNGPPDMTIDPATGAIDWYPESNGAYPVSLAASDSLGLSSAQIYTLTVGDPVTVPDLVGLSEADAGSALAGVGLALGSRFFLPDPVAPAGDVLAQSPPAGAVAELGSSVRVTLSNGPTQADTDSDGDGFTPNAGDCNDGDDIIYPGAPEIDADGIDQSCNGIDGNKTLTAIEVTPTVRRLLTGQPQPLRAMGIFEDGTAQDLTRIASWTRGPTFSSANAGDYTAEASFQGVTGSADFEVLDRVDDVAAPIARIFSPSDGEVLTAPTTVVVTARDTNLLRWELSYRPVDQTDWVVFAEDTVTRVEYSGSSLDTTTLLNGQYEIRLRVFDRGGNVSEDSVTVRVEGQFKVGNFTLRYLDLDLPLNGIPISLVRTYDSRDKRVSDFGVGWQLGINSVEIIASRELGSAWQVYRQGLSYGLTETDLHLVGVRLPGGRIETFEMVVGPSVSPIVPFPPFSQSVSFRALPGTFGTLEALGSNNVSILDAQPGPVTLRRDNDGAVYNPTLFRYTTPQGLILDLDIEDGIQRAETPAGQVLTVTPAQISHSNGTIVSIERDAVGRITGITDPAGFSQSYAYDANGDLRSHTDQDGYVTRFDYDGDHNVIRITDPLNRITLRNTYDDEGRLISATNSAGDTIHYAHDVAGRQEVVTDPDGFETVLDYDEAGNVLQVTDPLGGVTKNTFDGQGNRLSTTDPTGAITTFSYDSAGRVIRVTDPIGGESEYTYTADNRLRSEVDALGRVTRYEYNASGALIRTIDPSGAVSERTVWDGDGNIVSTEDAAGNARLYGRDARGYLNAITDPRGNREELSLDANGTVLARTDARGGTDTYVNDGRGWVSRIQSPVGTETEFAVNGVGELASVRDELGNATSVTSDAAGRIVQVTSPDGSVIQMGYDGRGNRTRIVDGSGRETRFEYDALGRQTRMILPGGGFVATQYDAVGRVLSETDPNGNTTEYEYDAAGRNTAVIDALGNRTEFDYDLVGNLTSRLDARGNRTDYVYDDLDRLVRTEYADGSTETIDYDPVGNVIAQTDRLGRTQSYTYDANDNLLTVTAIDGAVTAYRYDENNNRVSQTDANGNTTRMVYDANDRLTEKQYPDGSTERYEYDAGNRVARTILPDGKVIAATYDGFGRPTGHNLNGEGSESFTYDGAGRLEQAVNLWGSVDYRYDSGGRVAEIVSEGGHSVSYTYDDLGNRTSITTQLSGQAPRITNYTYDALNRLATVMEPDGDTTTYAYDAVGNVASITYPNGVVSRFSYDTVNQLTRIEHREGGEILAAYDYVLDQGGRRLRVDHANGDSVSYAYDDADRLLQETHRNAGGVVIFEQAFGYDAVGNRVTRQVAGQAQTLLAYDSADKLLAAGATRFAYDANGRLIAKRAPQGTINYAYDVEGQLLRVTTSMGTITYGYDASGKRRSRTFGGSEQNFLLDESSLTGYYQTLLAFDENEDPLVEYHWGDRLISADDGSNDRFFHFDGSENTRLLTDELGAVSDTVDYDAFGSVRSRTGPADTPYGFAGEWQEQGADGLVFLRARYYDPATGRFISRDPYAGDVYDPMSLHRYLYANANPIMHTDPSGMAPLTLGQTIVVNAVISAGISLIVDGLAGKSPGEAISNAVIAAGFGAIGGAIGGRLAATAQKSLSSVAAASFTRKGIVVGTIIFTKAIVNTVLGAGQMLSSDLSAGSRGKYLNGRAVAQLFLINVVVEAVTMGYYRFDPVSIDVPLYNTPSASSRAAAAEQALGSGLGTRTRNLFKRWQASGEDVVAFLEKWGRGKSPNNPANRILANVAEMSSEATQVIKIDFTTKLRVIETSGKASALIETSKQVVQAFWGSYSN